MYKAILTALEGAQDQFNTNKATILTEIWKEDNPLTDGMKQWLNGINAGVAMLGSAGGPAGGVTAGFVSALLTGVQTGEDKPIDFEDMADLEK